MNLYLKTEKLDDIESVVANKEQQRLQDLLIFIEEYTNAESNISNTLGSLSELSDDWYLRVAPQMQPYIQFQMYQVETILARAMDVKVDQPIFSSDILRELSTALHTLYEVATGITEMEWIVLDWQEQDEGTNTVFLDVTSAMAKHSIIDNFDKKALPTYEDIDEQAWKRSFNSSESLLLNVLPEVIPHLHKHLRVIVPIIAQNSRISLSSTPSILNGVFLTSWTSSKYFAETLVHEISHDCLNKLNLIESLVEDSQKGFYSPFRIDTRPASGLLHAAYSFLNVCQYLFRVSNLEERLSTWAQYRLNDYLFNSILCSRLLIVSNELTKAGTDLVLSMIKAFEELQNSCDFHLDEEMYKSKQMHFEAWAIQADEKSKEFSRELFERVLKETSVRKNVVKMKHKLNRPIVKSLEWFRVNYQHTKVPVIIQGESLVKKKKLKSDLDAFKNQHVKVLDASKHKGFANTPGKVVTVDQHIRSFGEGKTKNTHFLVVKNFEKHISSNIWKKDKFFDGYWIDGEHSWLFWNSSGLVVPLHNDSVNNLHCAIEGEKLFYLSQPEEVFHLEGSESDFNDGFSAFKPFENVEESKKYGTFLKISAGDMLYLPSGWWHSVNYLTHCLAISAFDEYTTN